MGALMLLFALSASGQSGTMAVLYDSMVTCEAARGGILKALTETVDSSGEKVVYVAAVCVEPIKVLAV